TDAGIAAVGFPVSWPILMTTSEAVGDGVGVGLSGVAAYTTSATVEIIVKKPTILIPGRFFMPTGLPEPADVSKYKLVSLSLTYPEPNVADRLCSETLL